MFGRKKKEKLLAEGLLGRAVITDVQATGGQRSRGEVDIPLRGCVITLEVALDNTPRYTAECKEWVLLTDIPRLVPGETVVAVRVNPDNHDEVAIDSTVPPPVVKLSASDAGSAAEVLRIGESATAVIVESRPLGMKSPSGVDVHLFVLTVVMAGRDPYQVTVGNPLPPAALPLAFPGSNVPVKVHPNEADRVVIDWDQALQA